MGAPGGAVYLGRVLGWIAKDLGGILERFGRPRLGGPDAGVEDIPLLIKALSFDDNDVRNDALRALRRLSGSDFGDEPASWARWWETKSKELRIRRDAEIGLERLFTVFRASVMKGRWRDAAACLGPEVVAPGEAVDLEAALRKNRRALRQAYRDAGLEHLVIEGRSAKLVIGWGRLGFDQKEVRATIHEGKWRFCALPWGRRIVRQPKKPIKQSRPGQHVTLPSKPLDSTAILMVVFGIVLGIFLLIVVFRVL
ncbi:MAG: hypothetical protein ACYTFI_17385 [Planctomycetota bacterium]|jgi:hypothetical protein